MIKVNDKIIDLDNFPDGTLLMKYGTGNDKEFMIDWYYENDAELFALICLVREIQSDGFNNYSLYMPYFAHARMDRVKEYNDVFTLKYFCEVINSLNFKKVTVCDVHSNVTLALLNNVELLSAKDYIKSTLEELNTENPVLFFPDEGAMKRYSGDFKHNLFTYSNKVRDWETGKINKLNIVEPEIVKDRNILIVDDICSYGGTFHRAAKALKEAGAKNIYLYVTHAEKNMVKGDMYLSDDIIHIYTTSSIFDTMWDQRNKVTIVG